MAFRHLARDMPAQEIGPQEFAERRGVLGKAARAPQFAGELRRAGGFAKDTTPFSEFLWADFLRRVIPRKVVEDHFSKALEKALAAAKTHDAIYLPGWCGPADDD